MTVELLLNFSVRKSVRLRMLLNNMIVFELMKDIRILYNHNYEVGLPALYETLVVCGSQSVVSVVTRVIRQGLSCLRYRFIMTEFCVVVVVVLLLLLLPLALQPDVGFGLSNNILLFFPICHQFSPSSHS
jgi:hypothetical protein